MPLRTADTAPRASAPYGVAERRSHAALPWIAGVLAVLALAAGVLVPVKRATPASVVKVPALSGVTLMLPADWTPLPEPPALRGLGLTRSAAYSPGARPSEAAIVLGTGRAAAPTYLPSSFVDRPGVRVPAARPIAIGPSDALLYSGVAIPGTTGRLDLYVIPSDRGVYVVACRASAARAAAFLPACRTAAQSLTLPVVQTAQVSAVDPAFARTVGKTLTHLRTRRNAERAHFVRARTAKRQAAAALGLTAAYRVAATRIHAGATRLPTNGAAGDAGLVVALGATARSYRALASAAAHREGSAFRAARARVVASEAVVVRQLRALAALGYRP